MKIKYVLYPIEALGPGERIVIYTVGCTKKCVGCANKDLWCSENTPNISIKRLYNMIQKIFEKNKVDGITITGGDPFEQLIECSNLIDMLSELTDDILVYTGYTLSELENLLKANNRSDVLSNIAVLIDGRYIQEKNDNMSPLIGSTNQKIHFLNSKIKRKYIQYIENGRKVQNVYTNNGIISVGIHNNSKIS